MPRASMGVLALLGVIVMINAQAYLKALHPLEPAPLHLSDEDVAMLLDKEAKHKARAQKAANTRKKKQEAQQHD